MQKSDIKYFLGANSAEGFVSVFKECYNILGGVDTTIPVDIYVPGCAARPQAIPTTNERIIMTFFSGSLPKKRLSGSIILRKNVFFDSIS